MKKPPLQPLQAKGNLSIAGDLESFNQGRNARGVDVGDFAQVENHGCRCLPTKYGQEAVAKGWRRIDGDSATQAEDCALLVAINRNLKSIGRIEFAALQVQFPLLVQACSLPNDGAGLSPLISVH